MRFVTLGEDTVRIILDENDMERFGVSYENMDYGNTHTKKIIWELLDKAKSSTGFDTDGKKLHIQVYPSGDKGCEMYISKLQGEREDETKLYSFSELEGLLCALFFLRSKQRERGCELYFYNGSYYLSVKYRLELPEFGERVENPLTLPFLREHGCIVADRNGVVSLIEAFARRSPPRA